MIGGKNRYFMFLQNNSAQKHFKDFAFISVLQKALQKLIRGNELELAISVGRVLGNLEALTGLATELLSRRCEKLGRW